MQVTDDHEIFLGWRPAWCVCVSIHQHNGVIAASEIIQLYFEFGRKTLKSEPNI